MYGDVKGVIISLFFVILILVVAEIIRKMGNFSTEFTRKFVHIGVAHWWLIAMFSIKDIRYALLPPVIFVLLNYYSYKNDLIKSMERNKSSSDLGTVYFPVSLIILILLTWDGGILGKDLTYLGALGVLTMGYGDGFAAIVGKKFGKRKYKIFGNEKSIEGSITMFFFAFLVSAIITGSFLGFTYNMMRISFAIAFLATLIEALTPHGFDNLTVPLFTTLIAYYFVESGTAFFPIYLACIGFILSFIIAYAAYRKQSLTLSGAIGATLLGTAIYATSNFYGFSTMIFFFLSSSLLSHFKRNKKGEVALKFNKTGHRDILQVFANGGVGMIHSILFYLTNNPSFLVFLGVSFAAATADTWATELGILNKKNPLSLRTFKKVEKGTSGAVSAFGTISSLLGSMTIGIFVATSLFFTNTGQLGFEYIKIFLIVTLGGFAGALIDSILGATIQGIYYSEELGGETERKVHNGKPNKLIRGFSFANNDLVNFLSIGIASILFFGIT